MSARTKTQLGRSQVSVVTNHLRTARHNPASAPRGCLQRSAVNANPIPAIPSSVHETLRSPGQPLDVATRSFMEPRFGRDFSHVRVHTDSHAADSAHAVNAHAYTVGSHVVFGENRYFPGSTQGKKLLAHELTHTVQQWLAPANEVQTIAGYDSAEREADQVAHSVGETNETLVYPKVSSGGQLRRQPIYPQDVDKTLDPKTPPLAGPYTTGPLSQPPPPTPPAVVPCFISEDCKKPIPGSSWDFSHAAEAKRSETEKDIKKEPEKAKALGTARPAVNLKAFADSIDPKILANVSQVRVEPSMEGASGGRATNCAGAIPEAGKPACIEVPDKLEKEADIFIHKKNEPLIGGFSRLEWQTTAQSTLVHEAEHISFDKSPPVAAGQTTNTQGVFQFSPAIFLYELGEINSLLSEFPVRYRGIMAEPKMSPDQKTAAIKDWLTTYAINNKMEDLTGMLKKLRCISPCGDVKTALKTVYKKQSDNWTKEQKDLFVGVVSDPKQGLDWPK